MTQAPARLPQDSLAERIRRLSRRLRPRATDRSPNLERVRDVEAVVFDIYGTLFISAAGDINAASEAARERAFAAALEACRLCAKPDSGTLAEEGVRRFTAAVDREHARLAQAGSDHPEVDVRRIWGRVLAGMADAGLLERAPDRSLVERFAVEFECVANPVWPMPHAAKTLGRLRERGLVMGIVSNAQFFTPLLFRAFFNLSPNQLGFAHDLCVFSFERGIAKPSPVLFRLLGDRLAGREIEPRRILYVGNDMRNDILPAARCGWQTALFAGDRRSLRERPEHPDCRALRPDAVVTSLAQLLELGQPE